MMPVGYMAKHLRPKPEFLKAPWVTDIYSVSGCISENFADSKYVNYFNGFWFFNSLDEIRDLSIEYSIARHGTSLFYYEAYEAEFDGKRWLPYAPDPTLITEIVPPRRKHLKGFDVVTFSMHVGPECSPLSCNSLAEHVPTNEHCLLDSFKDAEQRIDDGTLTLRSEPGPFRIFAVYTVDG